jgi:signal transduction histidine kinase
MARAVTAREAGTIIEGAIMTTQPDTASPVPADAAETSSATSSATSSPGGYGALWRSMPRELLYLLVSFPLALAGFGITIGLFSGGVGTIFTFFIGVVLIIAALYVARGFGTAQVVLLEWTTRRTIPRPEWLDSRARTGFLGWLRAVLGNGHYWLYLLHTMLLDFLISTISWTITVVWLSISLGGLTAWFWDAIIPPDAGDFFVSQWIADRLGVAIDNPRTLDTLILLALGVLFTLTLPLITRGLTRLHWLIARGVLAAFKSDALLREVADLSASRGAAISAEGTSLRRLERDIHDGPQQRLVRLQMDLAAAERQLDTDPEKARGLISEAMQQSKDALEELRALSRGFAPPILLDRGLVAALESAAVRSTVPARIVSALPDGVSYPQEIERNAYFIASEAMVNAAKHSGATEIVVRVWERVDETGTWLDLTVSDDGHGGAFTIAGHGLAGLEERLRGLGGSFELASPSGGPTVLTAHLPVAPAAASRA